MTSSAAHSTRVGPSTAMAPSPVLQQELAGHGVRVSDSPIVDLTMASSAQRYRAVLASLLASPDCDAVLAVVGSSAQFHPDFAVQPILDTPWSSKPLAAFLTPHAERSLALLAREGIATDGYFSKSWDDLPVTPDIVISVCGNAANEVCPAYLGPVLRSHWGVDDPAHATGTDAEVDAAFMTAYRILRSRIEAFLALPLDTLKHDGAALKAEMDRIAGIGA